MVAGVARTSTNSPVSAYGTLYQLPSKAT
jgi:hypothetical protein